MEAIMKAFEKMEKRQVRRKDALTRLDGTPGKRERENSTSEVDEEKKEMKAIKTEVILKINGKVST